MINDRGLLTVFHFRFRFRFRFGRFHNFLRNSIYGRYVYHSRPYLIIYDSFGLVIIMQTIFSIVLLFTTISSFDFLRTNADIEEFLPLDNLLPFRGDYVPKDDLSNDGRKLFRRASLPRNALDASSALEVFHLRSFPQLLIDSQAGKFLMQTSGIAFRSTVSPSQVYMHPLMTFSVTFSCMKGSRAGVPSFQLLGGFPSHHQDSSQQHYQTILG